MQSEISTFAGQDRRWLVVAAVVIIAIVIGATVAGANWIVMVALLVLPIFALRREVSFGIYAFLLPFEELTAVRGGGTLTLIAGAMACTVLLGTALVKKDLQRPPRQALWWASLVTWGAVTVLWALAWQPATSRLFTAVSLLLVYLAVLSANISRKELETISLFAVAGACAAAGYTAFQFFGGALYQGEMRGSLMVGDKAADPNVFAAGLLLPLSLAVYGFLTPRGWLARLGWLVAAATIAFGIFVTMSRGALVGVAVMILFYGYTRVVSRGMIIALVVVFLALTFVLPNNFVTRLQTAADSGGSGRTVIWQGGLVAFGHYPLIGAGLNNFTNAYLADLGSAPIYRGHYSIGAHNSYLEIAVETGLIGFVLLLAAIVGQLRAASRCRKNEYNKFGSVVAYEAGCYAILASAFFLGVLWDKWYWLAWTLLAVAVRTAQAGHTSGAKARLPEVVVWPWEDVQVPSTPGVKTTGLARSRQIHP